MRTTLIGVLVEVGEQLAVDDVADRVVVRVAVEEVDRAVEHRQERVEVVDDDEDRHTPSLACRSEELDDLVLVAHVEVGERFVEQEQLGVADERLRDRDPLLLATGELRHRVGRRTSSAETAVERRVDPGAVVAERPTETPARAGPAERDQVPAPDRIADRGGVVLRHVADARVAPVRRLAEHVQLARRARGTRPRIISSSVVLPEPFGPMTPTIAPAGTANVPSDQIDIVAASRADPVEREGVGHACRAPSRGPRSWLTCQPRT